MVIMLSSVVTQMLFRLLTPAPLRFWITKQPLKIKCFYREWGKKSILHLPKETRVNQICNEESQNSYYFSTMILLLEYLEGIINRMKFLFCDYITTWSNFSLTRRRFLWGAFERSHRRLHLWQQRTNWGFKVFHYWLLLIGISFVASKTRAWAHL